MIKPIWEDTIPDWYPYFGKDAWLLMTEYGLIQSRTLCGAFFEFIKRKLTMKRKYRWRGDWDLSRGLSFKKIGGKTMWKRVCGRSDWKGGLYFTNRWKKRLRNHVKLIALGRDFRGYGITIFSVSIMPKCKLRVFCLEVCSMTKTDLGIIIGASIASGIVGALLRKQQEEDRLRSEELVRTTTEAMFDKAFEEDRETMRQMRQYFDERLDEARDKYMKAETEDGPE